MSDRDRRHRDEMDAESNFNRILTYCTEVFDSHWHTSLMKDLPLLDGKSVCRPRFPSIRLFDRSNDVSTRRAVDEDQQHSATDLRRTSSFLDSLCLT